MRYGQRFRLLRERAGLGQEDVAEKLQLERQRGSSVSNIEVRSVTPPARVATLLRHAAALNCQPWELLAGVATGFDRLRTPVPLSNEDLGVLLWGLPLIDGKNLRAVMDTMRSFLDALPPAVRPTPIAPRVPGHMGKAKQTHRGTKSA